MTKELRDELRRRLAARDDPTGIFTKKEALALLDSDERYDDLLTSWADMKASRDALARKAERLRRLDWVLIKNLARKFAMKEGVRDGGGPLYLSVTAALDEYDAPLVEEKAR